MVQDLKGKPKSTLTKVQWQSRQQNDELLTENERLKKVCNCFNATNRLEAEVKVLCYQSK